METSPYKVIIQNVDSNYIWILASSFNNCNELEMLFNLPVSYVHICKMGVIILSTSQSFCDY